MIDKLKIASMNVQGLGDKQKRKGVLDYLRKKKANIYFLQDTHFTNKEISYIRTQWGYECYFNNFNSQSRGVAIFINSNFDFKHRSIERDDNGNLIILHCKVNGKDLSLFNIYGPNQDDPNFYNNVKNKLAQIENECILAGDFNLVIDPNKDYFNYLHINNPEARDTVLQMMIEFDLIDCWREMHIEQKQYTWFRKNPTKKARLDLFLITGTLFIELDNVQILPGYRTDHSLIMLSLQLGEIPKR